MWRIPKRRDQNHAELLILSALVEEADNVINVKSLETRGSVSQGDESIVPVFRWMQAITETPSLTDDEMIAALRTINGVKIHMSYLRDAHGMSMSPGCHYYRTVSEDSESSSQPVDVIFFSLPFFDRKPLLVTSGVGTHTPDAFPSKTMYQTHYRYISTTEREKRQVLRSLGSFIYVSQLWCLMINKKFIFTNAPAKLSKIVGESIIIQTTRLKASPSIMASLVSYEDSTGQVYFFDAESCKNWAGLIGCIKAQAPKSANDTAGQYELQLWTDDGVLITNSNWSQVLESGTRPTIKLSAVNKNSGLCPTLQTPEIQSLADDTKEMEEGQSRDLDLSTNSVQCKIVTSRGERHGGERRRLSEPADPYGIIGLITGTLVDLMKDILSGYNHTASSLESQVQDNPDIRLFKTLNSLNEELRIIRETLSTQREVIKDLQKICNHASEHDTSSARLREHTFGRSIKTLEQGAEDINEMIKSIPELRDIAEKTLTQSNDRAIRIFTVVTVVYLPLSFVSGFLGMNTSDIRNMNNSQSLFWIIAIPTTTVTLAVALYLLVPSLRRRISSFFVSLYLRLIGGDGG